MSKIVFVRAEILDSIASGQVLVKLLASGTDGMNPFYTKMDDLISPPVPQHFRTAYMGRPNITYGVAPLLSASGLVRFMDEANERGYQIISMTQADDRFSVLYRR